MDCVRVRVLDGKPVRVWWGFPSLPVTAVLRTYTLPARHYTHPVYGQVPLRRQRDCWRVQLGDGRRVTLIYEHGPGRWLVRPG